MRMRLREHRFSDASSSDPSLRFDGGNLCRFPVGTPDFVWVNQRAVLGKSVPRKRRSRGGGLHNAQILQSFVRRSTSPGELR